MICGKLRYNNITCTLEECSNNEYTITPIAALTRNKGIAAGVKILRREACKFKGKTFSLVELQYLGTVTM